MLVNLLIKRVETNSFGKKNFLVFLGVHDISVIGRYFYQDRIGPFLASTSN